MKNFFTLLVFVSLGFMAGAQTTSSNNPVKNDPDAKKVLDAVSAKFRTYKSPQATFTYKIENAQGKAVSTKKGTVKMKGSRYRVSIPGMEIFSDGKINWNYDKGANEVTVKDIDVNSGELSPQKLFTLLINQAIPPSSNKKPIVNNTGKKLLLYNDFFCNPKFSFNTFLTLTVFVTEASSTHKFPFSSNSPPVGPHGIIE